MSYFPPKRANRRQRSQTMPSPSPSQFPLTDDFLFKLKNLASRYEKMKIAYHELKSQINTGLLEAEEVFASLAIPLMKLVGLKTMEMAEEGRISTIITDNSLNHGNRKDGLEPETPATGERDHHINAPEGESYVTKATVAGKELMVKQQTNLLQLVHLLRQIETQVNFRQDDILATLGNHRAVLHKFFQKAVHYISTLHGQNSDIFMTTLKLLQVIFNNVNTVLVSVEGGVEDLVHELAEKMCNPMMKYVKGLKDDMANGTCMRLVAIVEEMDKMMVDEKRELEDARKKVRLAEEAKIEAMYKLKGIEDRVRKMKEQLSLPDTQRALMENYTPHKLLGLEEEQAKDEKLLWTLLKKKRKCEAPASPMGPQGLFCLDANYKACKAAVANGPLDNRRLTRSATRQLVPQTPCLNNWISLGSSPSLAVQQAKSRKRAIR